MTSYRDWVVELSNTTGTGAYALAGAPAGTSYFTFRQRYSDGDDDLVFWVVNPTRTKWEKNRFGALTYGIPDTLSRNVVESTNGDAPVSWVAGDTPLRIYVVPDAEAQEFAITMGLGAARPGILKYGLWSDEDGVSAGVDQVNFFDGASDIPVAQVDRAAHSMVLDPTLAGWRVLAEANPSAASSVDFINIPSDVDHLMVLLELQVGTDGADIRLRTYDAGGSLDSGASDYQWLLTSIATTLGTGVIADASDSFISLGSTIDSGNGGITGQITASNIQAARHTKFLFETLHLNTAASAWLYQVGGGLRAEADRITGLSLFPSTGTITGKVTLFVR